MKNQKVGFHFLCPKCNFFFTANESKGIYTYKCPQCLTDCSDQSPIQPEGLCEGWTWQDVEDEMP